VFKLTPLVLLSLTLSGGCSKEEMKKMAESVKEKSQSIAESTKEMATQAVETAKEQLPETGEVTLQLNPPIKIDSAKIEVVSVGDGRSNIVQIATYDVSSAPKSYPSVLIQGRTEAGDPASLAGQTVACELFMRADSTGPIAMTAASQPAQVTFDSYDPEARTVSASIRQVTLVGSDNKPVALAGGTILAVMSK
jgi:hypothetical protein